MEASHPTEVLDCGPQGLVAGCQSSHHLSMYSVRSTENRPRHVYARPKSSVGKPVWVTSRPYLIGGKRGKLRSVGWVTRRIGPGILEKTEEKLAGKVFSVGLELAGHDLERLGGWMGRQPVRAEGNPMGTEFGVGGSDPLLGRFRLFSVDLEGGSVVSAVESTWIARRDHAFSPLGDQVNGLLRGVSRHCENGLLYLPHHTLSTYIRWDYLSSRASGYFPRVGLL
jgi:hypothetical protein